jgi:hypothetical protein
VAGGGGLGGNGEVLLWPAPGALHTCHSVSATQATGRPRHIPLARAVAFSHCPSLELSGCLAVRCLVGAPHAAGCPRTKLLTNAACTDGEQCCSDVCDSQKCECHSLPQLFIKPALLHIRTAGGPQSCSRVAGCMGHTAGNLSIYCGPHAMPASVSASCVQAVNPAGSSPT